MDESAFFARDHFPLAIEARSRREFIPWICHVWQIFMRTVEVDLVVVATVKK
jgi:hypothetical protein